MARGKQSSERGFAGLNKRKRQEAAKKGGESSPSVSANS